MLLWSNGHLTMDAQSCNRSTDRTSGRFEICRCSCTKEPAYGPTQWCWKTSLRFNPCAWRSRCSRTWVVTVVEALANSYMPTTSVRPHGMVEAGKLRKTQSTPLSLSRICSFSYVFKLWNQLTWMVNASSTAWSNAFISFRHSGETFLYQRISMFNNNNTN